MIVFDLACANDHRFEAWFRDSAAYDRQSAAGDVSCPICADSRVSKAPMAPHVARSVERATAADERSKRVARELTEVIDTLRRRVEENCDYVGVDFAEEARRIHYGETEPRNIYGESNEAESTALKEEGIEVQHIPWLVRRDS